MKKVLFALAVLLIASPAMANNVDISCGYVGGNWFAINYSVTPTPANPRVAAFALTIATNLGVIDQIRAFKTGESTAADPGYGIFPGSITWPGPVWGDPVAPAASPPGTQGVLGNSDIIIELGALYDRTIPADGPLDADTLCEIHVSDVAMTPDAADDPAYNAIVLTIAEELAARGGIVMENLVPPTVNIGCVQPACWNYALYPCFECGDGASGDATNPPVGPPNGFITYNPDVMLLFNAWTGAYEPCADRNRDGWINFNPDVMQIMNHWPAAPKAPHIGGCGCPPNDGSVTPPAHPQC